MADSTPGDRDTAYLCVLDDIPPGSCRGFDLAGGHKFFVVRTENGLYGYLNRCPHARLELNWMPDRFLDITRNYIACSAHGALFEIETGKCIVGPCPGQRLTPLPVFTSGGVVYANVSSITET